MPPTQLKYLDLTLPTPEENLACDEALLDAAEGGEGGEVLRVWEPATPFVVLGYANMVQAEVNVEICRQLKVPILRRCSGGGTILQGPGCLNYALVLRITDEHRSVAGSNRLVMERQQTAIEQVIGIPVQVEGITDLTLGNRKFSGNAQRRRHQFLLFHGTLLLAGYDQSLMAAVLSLPDTRPHYRGDRSHLDFVSPLPTASRASIKQSLRSIWAAESIAAPSGRDKVATLVSQKYGSETWNLKR